MSWLWFYPRTAPPTPKGIWLNVWVPTTTVLIWNGNSVIATGFEEVLEPEEWE